jgi:hypothetical protein
VLADLEESAATAPFKPSAQVRFMVSAMEAMEARMLAKLGALDGLQDCFRDLTEKLDLQATRLDQPVAPCHQWD